MELPLFFNAIAKFRTTSRRHLAASCERGVEGHSDPNEGVMTNPLFRGAGFTPPVRSAQTVLRGIAMPQLVALLTLVVCTAAVLMAVSWSVSSAGKRDAIPVSSNIQSRLL
jgi:hypothetical protein